MQQTVPQCANCGAFTRRSLHHEEEYQSSGLLERLRTSNFPATDEEIAHIRHTILPTVSDDISSINSKVASLQEVIRSMEEERERLINVQKRYHNLFSLSRTLPSEIWSEIFKCTLSSDSDFNAFDASGSMWRLSHVCQKWRNVALSLHSFWSTMHIRFPKAAQQNGDVQRLETAIQRSGQRLLDLSLSDDIILNLDCNPSILRRMLDILLTESHRWQEFHLSDRQGILNMLYAPLHNRLPRLEFVGLYCAPLELEGASAVSVFKDCPCLTKLALGGGTLGFEFPWDQITELDLSLMDLGGREEERRACTRLIGRCPSLEILSTPFWYSNDESANTPIICSNVRKLDATSAFVIDALTLPSLRDASLGRHPNAFHSASLYSFKQLLMRSNCMSTLTRLSLDSVPLAPLPDHTLHSILSQTQNLTSLDLTVFIQELDDDDDEPDDSDQEQIVAIVKSLEVVPTQPVTFLPLLSSLDIQVLDHQDSSNLPYFGPVGRLAAMVKARWEGGNMLGLARLTRCHFHVHARLLHMHRIVYRDDDVSSGVRNVFKEEERCIFKGLIDDGMDLSIRVMADVTEHYDHHSVFAVPPYVAT